MPSVKQSIVVLNSEKNKSTIDYFELVKKIRKNNKPRLVTSSNAKLMDKCERDIIFYFGETGEKRNKYF